MQPCRRHFQLELANSQNLMVFNKYCVAAYNIIADHGRIDFLLTLGQGGYSGRTSQ